MSERTAVFRYECDVVLKESEIWPDGAPEGWTIEDVWNVIKECGGHMRILDDWDLRAAMTFDLYVYSRG